MQYQNMYFDELLLMILYADRYDSVWYRLFSNIPCLFCDIVPVDEIIIWLYSRKML